MAKLNKEAFTATISHVLHGEMNFDDAPSTLEDARSCPNWPKWKSAMDEEMQTLHKMGTWELTELPKDKKPILCQWVYALKQNSNDDIIRYKARLVAQGFPQEFGVDYRETFAPVIQLDVLWLILAMAVIKGWDMQQLDIKSAYLHGKLEETIFMTQPPEFEAYPRLVCRLIQSLWAEAIRASLVFQI